MLEFLYYSQEVTFPSFSRPYFQSELEEGLAEAKAGYNTHMNCVWLLLG